MSIEPAVTPIQARTNLALTKPATQAQPAFGGMGLLHHRYGGAGSKLITKMLELDQGVHGNAASMFLADSMTVWAPKAAFVRSLPEFVEMTFLEYVESGLFYFMPSLLAQYFFKRAFMGLNPKSRQFKPELLTKDLSKLTPQMAKKVAPVKMAIILASVGAAFAGEYALSFVKNLMTKGLFNLTRFDEVAALKDGKQKSEEATDGGKDPVTEKAHRRIKQCGVLAATCIALATLMTLKGINSKAGMNASKFVSRFLDFRYGKDSKGAITFGLGAGQIFTVIYAGATSYADAARDALERIEVGIRANITAWYLAFGSLMLKRTMLRHFLTNKAFQDTGVIQKVANPQPQMFGYLGGQLTSKLFGKDKGKALEKYFTSELSIMGLEEADKMAFQKAKDLLTKQGKPLSKALLDKTAWQFRKNTLAQQNMLYYIPKLFGAVVISGGIALLMRIMTAQRYKRWKNQGHEYFTQDHLQLEQGKSTPSAQNASKPKALSAASTPASNTSLQPNKAVKHPYHVRLQTQPMPAEFASPNTAFWPALPPAASNPASLSPQLFQNPWQLTAQANAS